jgi:hypothetical protein
MHKFATSPMTGASTFAYPISKAARLAKAPPSAQRTADALALGTSFTSTMRRVPAEIARRRARQAAERIVTHR